MAKIIVRYQNQTLAEFPLKGGISTIGRLPSHAIAIENLGISRNHAFVLGDLDEKVFVLEDLKSLNGTFVNKRRISRHLLRQGDVVTIGQHTLEYLEESFPSGPEARRPPNEGEPFLEELEGERRIPLSKDLLHFGNSSADDIHIPGLMVGKHFASLNRKGTVWVINVLVKRFATIKLNGEEIHSAKVQDGDELDVAGIRFRVHFTGG